MVVGGSEGSDVTTFSSGAEVGPLSRGEVFHRDRVGHRVALSGLGVRGDDDGRGDGFIGCFGRDGVGGGGGGSGG